MSDPDGKARFDRWAVTYDRDVSDPPEFPFAGYDLVLGSVVELAQVAPGLSVLDLGTGTGNLALRFAAASCSVWGTDFSAEMIRRAREKHPGIRFAVADLRAELPAGFPAVYDRIVSAYAFHHLPLADKVDSIGALVRRHLAPGGRLIIADVAFSTTEARNLARVRFPEAWDESEFYWAADETEAACRELPVRVSYRQVSICGGVFSFECRKS